MKNTLSKIALMLLATMRMASAGTYTTNFPLTENPISEGGRWINGKDVGLDWQNVQTIPGQSSGTQNGNSINLGIYDDSTAVLTGPWGPNQTVQATVVSGNQNTSAIEEVELRLRTTISAHSITGYELDFRNTNPGGYVAIVRWNGPLNNFTGLAGENNAYHGIKNGDVISGTVVGSLISVYVNAVLVCQATDSTYTGGSPGVGFWMSGAAPNTNTNFGLSSFNATDGSTPATTPSPPTGLRIVP